MLFVCVLFLLLLGTSVGALPVDHEPHFPVSIEHLGHHFPVSNNHRLESLSIIGHGPSYAVFAKGQGKELPFLQVRPLGTNHDPHSPRPLRLTGIAIHAGLWYREPAKNAHNIIEIRFEVVRSVQVAVIVFHEMGKMPGEVIWHSKPYIYLTDDNREWLVGTWHRMPSANLPIPLRGDKIMVAIRNGLLRYSVQGRLQLAIIPAIKEMGNPITHITWPLKCKGTWVRKIIKGTHKNYVDDVLTVMGGGSAQIFRLGSKPGEVLKEQQSIYPQRPVGIWCRMPDASTVDLPNRMAVDYIDGELVQEVYWTPVYDKSLRYYY